MTSKGIPHERDLPSPTDWETTFLARSSQSPSQHCIMTLATVSAGVPDNDRVPEKVPVSLVGSTSNTFQSLRATTEPLSARNAPCPEIGGGLRLTRQFLDRQGDGPFRILVVA